MPADETQAPLVDPREAQASPPAPLAEFWHYFSENRGAVVGLFTVLFIVFVALTAQWIAPYGPADVNTKDSLTPPVWQEGGTWKYILGTDPLGRDILSRIMHGSRYSLMMGCIAVSISLTFGIMLGMIAAFGNAIVEASIMRLMDIILAFPSLLLALVIVTILGPGLENAMIAVAIVYIPHFVRLSRASALGEMTRSYVTASRVAGAGVLRLMFVVVLPNCMGPLIVQATLSFSTALLDSAALGFLGLGAQPPLPEWGTMLSSAREFILRAWWVITFPGLAILITVLAFNLMGDGLRDALDPKLKRS